MRIFFLVGSYVPHQMLSINSFIENYNVEIHSVSVSENYKFIPTNTDKLKTYKVQDFTKQELLNTVVKVKPDLLVVAGWMIPSYVYVAKNIKKKSIIPVVAMSDTPWYGTWKQKINCLISSFYLKRVYTHLWVAGVRQYDYARKLGFNNNQIIFHSLTADINIFKEVNIKLKTLLYPKNFLYVGRFTEIKGLRNLMKAWSSIEDKKGWSFTLIGSGEMYSELNSNENFIVKDFMSQEDLIEEMQNAGCFVLPSLKEPWALVIHEAAVAGLPIICTETCGSSAYFVINNFNGYKVLNNSVDDLKDKLEKIINAEDLKLVEFSEKSRSLSTIINPEVHMASLLQLIYEKK